MTELMSVNSESTRRNGLLGSLPDYRAGTPSALPGGRRGELRRRPAPGADRPLPDNVGFRIGDALALPLHDDSFDICRIETVLQHLADPRRAVAEMAEMARVTRPGGRVAALEFDLETVFLDHPDLELSDAIRALSISAAVQRSIGRQVPRLFAEAGLTHVKTASRVILTGAYFFRLLLLGYHVNELCAGDVIAPERATRWWTAMDDAAASGHLTGAGTAFVVCGTIN